MKLPERWRWRFVWGALAVSIGTVSLAAVVLSHGTADPPHAQPLAWEDTTLDWLNGTQPQPIPAKRVYYQAPQPLPPEAFSVAVEGTLLADTPTLATWGIWLTVSTDTRLLIGLNGHQYVTARYCTVNENTPLYACPPALEPGQGIETVWKFFHLIAPVNTRNVLELHYLPDTLPGRLMVRFDGEWMWSIQFEPGTSILTWGVWSTSSTKNQTHVQWTASRIWGRMRQK